MSGYITIPSLPKELDNTGTVTKEAISEMLTAIESNKPILQTVKLKEGPFDAVANISGAVNLGGLDGFDLALSIGTNLIYFKSTGEYIVAQPNQ